MAKKKLTIKQLEREIHRKTLELEIARLDDALKTVGKRGRGPWRVLVNKKRSRR
jgi:hypothetical protein